MANGIEEFQRAMSEFTDALSAGVVDATQAAGQILFDEIHARAKGSVRDNLTLSVEQTEHGAHGKIQVHDSAPGGKEHHAVFLEFGTSKMVAEPFMRPGYDVAAPRAVEQFATVLANKVKG